MKKRVVVCALASVMALTCFAACGKEDESIIPDDFEFTEKVDIEFWGWGDLAEQNNYQTLVNQFMAEPGNENINVTYVGNTSTVHMQNLENRVKNLPQLFMLPDYDFYGWVADDTLKDITPYVTEEELSVVWPQAVDEYYYNPSTSLLGKSDGAKLYGLPKDLGPFTLVYNQDLLDKQITANSAKLAENGLDHDKIYAELLNPTDPMTWTEFRTLLKLLVPGLGDNQYGISHYEIEAAIYSNNANFFNDEASEQRITDPRFIEALQFCADLDLVDHVMTPEAKQDVDGFTRFQGGNCIFSFMGPWDCSQFWSFNIPFKTNILPVPYNGDNPDAVSTAWVGSMGYCIGKNATSLQTAAAIRLAKYLCMNENAQRKFYELGQQVPNIMTMAKDEYVNDTKGLIAGKDPADRSVWLDTIDGTSATDRVGGKVRPRYYTYSSGWYTDLVNYIADQGMWKGTKTAQEICTAYASILQDKLTKMRKELGIR